MTTEPNFCPTCGSELASDDNATIKALSRDVPVKFAVHCGKCKNSANIEDRTSSRS